MSELDTAVLSQLKHGRYGAKPGQVIAKSLRSNDRSVRLAIRRLITAGYPVASAVDFPPGYFIARTWAEVNSYAQSLRSRLIEDAKRRRDFIRAARTKVPPEQLELIAK